MGKHIYQGVTGGSGVISIIIWILSLVNEWDAVIAGLEFDSVGLRITLAFIAAVCVGLFAGPLFHVFAPMLWEHWKPARYKFYDLADVLSRLINRAELYAYSNSGLDTEFSIFASKLEELGIPAPPLSNEFSSMLMSDRQVWLAYFRKVEALARLKEYNKAKMITL